MFAYPPQAAFNRPVPKSRIYDHARPTKAVRERFVREVDEIVWSYKLSPETINVPPAPGAQEIQIFTLTLKTPELSEAVLRTIDEAIPSLLFFRLRHGDRVRGKVAYKRPSEADGHKWVVEDYYESAWQPSDSPCPALPVALNLGILYAQMLRPYLQPPPRPGETMAAHVNRLREIRRLSREADDLAERLPNEKQFNREVDINAQQRALKQQLQRLSAPIS